MQIYPIRNLYTTLSTIDAGITLNTHTTISVPEGYEFLFAAPRWGNTRHILYLGATYNGNNTLTVLLKNDSDSPKDAQYVLDVFFYKIGTL